MTDKLDKYHYHELLHTIDIIRSMCVNHLIDHHAGQKYENEVLEISEKLHKLYNKVSNDSDELFNKGDLDFDPRDNMRKQIEG